MLARAPVILAVTAAVSILGPRAFGGPPGASFGRVVEEPIIVATEHQLFLDDYVIERTHRVRRVLHQPEKRAEPVLRPEMPWETSGTDFPRVVLDAQEGLYRMWYRALMGTGTRSTTWTGYATSRDGIHWERPSLGVVEFEGSTDNNIVLPGHGHVLWQQGDVADPAQQYRMVTWSRGAEWDARTSPDGIHWTRVDTGFDPGPSDQMAYDPETNQYWYLTQEQFPRLVGRRESRDGIHWSEPEIVLRPDPKDPPNLEMYSLWAYREGAQWAGFLSAYHVDDVNEPNPRIWGTIDVQLVVSRDCGRTWTRVADRQTWLPLGPDGSFDDGMILLGILGGAKPTRVGDRWFVYYSAWDGNHGVGDATGAVGLATLRPEGYVSMDGDAGGGVLVTKPLRLGAGRLHINADARRGSLRVALLEENGRALPGFGLGNCEPLNADSLDHVVAWGGRPALPEMTQPLRLKFELREAALYSVWVD